MRCDGERVIGGVKQVVSGFHTDISWHISQVALVAARKTRLAVQLKLPQ